MRRTNLSMEEISSMRTMRANGLSLRVISNLYHCHWTTVSKATNNRSTEWAQWLVNRGVGL